MTCIACGKTFKGSSATCPSCKKSNGKRMNEASEYADTMSTPKPPKKFKPTIVKMKKYG